MATPRRRSIIVDVVTDAHSNVQSIRKDIQEAFASSNMWIMGALPHSNAKRSLVERAYEVNQKTLLAHVAIEETKSPTTRRCSSSISIPRNLPITEIDCIVHYCEMCRRCNGAAEVAASVAPCLKSQNPHIKHCDIGVRQS